MQEVGTTKVSQDKFSVRYNVGIKSHDLRVILHNRSFRLGDESERDVKAQRDPHKKCGVSHSPPLIPHMSMCICNCSLREVDYSDGHPNFIEQYMLRCRTHTTHLGINPARWHNSSNNGWQYGNLSRTLFSVILTRTPQSHPGWMVLLSDAYPAWRLLPKYDDHASAASKWCYSSCLAHYGSRLFEWCYCPGFTQLEDSTTRELSIWERPTRSRDQSGPKTALIPMSRVKPSIRHYADIKSARLAQESA